MAEQQKQQPHVYIIGAFIIAVLAFIKHKKFPQIEWGFFIAGVLLLIIGFYYFQNKSKQGSTIVTQKEKDRIPSNFAKACIIDYMYWDGIPLDVSSAINVEEREETAIEETEKTDTPVFYLHIESEKTRDVYDIVLKTENNDTFRFLEKMKEKNIKDWNYYEKGIIKLTVSQAKNLPYIGKDRQIFIRSMINALASKSAQSYAYEWDQNTRKFLGRRIVKDKDPTEETEKEEDEE